MSEKKGFWSALFAPKKKTTCHDMAPACNHGKTETATKVIKVLGTGCSSCNALYSTVQAAVNELGIDAIVEKEEDLSNIMAYNVMTLPALVINDKVVSKGQKLTVAQVKQLLV